MSINTHPSNPCTNGKNQDGSLVSWLLCCMSHYYWTTHLTHLFTSAMVAWAFTTSNQWLLTRLCFVESLPLQSMIWTSLVHFQHIHGDGFETWCKWHKGPGLRYEWAMHIFICLDCPTYRSWSSLSKTLWRHGQLLCTTCFDGLWEFSVILSLCLQTFSKTSPACRSKFQPSSERNDEPCISWTPALL